MIADGDRQPAGDPRAASRRVWVHRQLTVLLLLAPAAVFPGLLAAGMWEPLLHSRVPHGDSDDLTYALVAAAACAVAFVVWLVAWFVPRGRPRAAVLIGSLLIGPLLVHAYRLDEALDHTPGRLAAREREQARYEADLRADDAEHDRRVSAWAASLPAAGPAGGVLFPPRAANGHLVWAGRDYGVPAWFAPGRAVLPAQPLLRTPSGDSLVVLRSDAGGTSSPVVLSAVGPRARARDLVSGDVEGAAVSPDGALVAYAQWTAPAPGSTAEPSSQVVVRDGGGREVGRGPIGDGGRVVGWNASGVIATERSEDRGVNLLGYGPAGGRPRVLGRYDVDEVLVAPGGDRVLVMDCELGATTGYDESEGRRPPAYPLAVGVGTATPGCVGRPGARVLATSGDRAAEVWSGGSVLTISPDGRYLVDDALEAVDIGSGRRTPLAPALTAAFRDAPRAARRWSVAGTPVLTGFWHDASTVEITSRGAPLAVCTVPAGPCLRTEVHDAGTSP